MKRDDHLALAVDLVRLQPNGVMGLPLKRAFFLGAILPDANPITYLRGAHLSGRPQGHDAKWSYPLLLRLLSTLRRTGVRTELDAYRLGTLTHYLADALTYPHTPGFCGGISEHNRYERELHRAFSAALADPDRHAPAASEPFLFLHAVLYDSAHGAHTPHMDAKQILCVCSAIWRSVFQENT